MREKRKENFLIYKRVSKEIKLNFIKKNKNTGI